MYVRMLSCPGQEQGMDEGSAGGGVGAGEAGPEIDTLVMIDRQVLLYCNTKREMPRPARHQCKERGDYGLR